MKRGLVLSGRAAWGLANIGVLKVMKREGFAFDYVAGSSMGAIVAGAYALGISIDVIEDTAAKISLLNVASIVRPPFQKGFHGGLLRQKLEAILSPIIGNARIGDAKIPFVCIAGKVMKPVSWEKIVFKGFAKHFSECIIPYVFPPETTMIDAMLASSAIPVVFAPVQIGNDTFVDLVHFGAIPARQLHALHAPDVIIGTDTNPRYGMLRRVLPAPWREFIDRGHAEIDADKDTCDLVIEPRMPAPIFRFDLADDFIVSGQLAAEKRLPELRQILDASHDKPRDGAW